MEVNRAGALKGRFMKQTICVLLFGALVAMGCQAQAGAGKKGEPASAKTPATSSSAEEQNLQAYIKLLRMDINKSKTQLIGEVMQFDSAQSATFWPIYGQFQTDYGKIGDQIVGLVNDYVQNYDTMTDQVADRLALKLLDIEGQRNELKRKYYTKLKAAMDPITAARFLQVEGQIEKLLDLQIASHLPIVGNATK
jgi:flagellar biosynthesis chaperone FliJ